MNSYNSQTIAHAGYLIVIAVGISAILYQGHLRTFFNNRWKNRVLYLYSLLSLLLGTTVYLILRIIFWAWMSSEVITVPYNSTATISAIQQTLFNKLDNQTIGWSSLSYSIDNQVYFGLSLIISIIIMFLLILGLDFAYFHRTTYVPRVRQDKWHNFYIVMSTVIIIFLFLAFYPPLITPTLQHLVNPNFKIAKGFSRLQPVGIGMGLSVIVLVIGYFAIVGLGNTVKVEVLNLLFRMNKILSQIKEKLG